MHEAGDSASERGYGAPSCGRQADLVDLLRRPCTAQPVNMPTAKDNAQDGGRGRHEDKDRSHLSLLAPEDLDEELGRPRLDNSHYEEERTEGEQRGRVERTPREAQQSADCETAIAISRSDYLPGLAKVHPTLRGSCRRRLRACAAFQKQRPVLQCVSPASAGDAADCGGDGAPPTVVDNGRREIRAVQLEGGALCWFWRPEARPQRAR
mmetsp:Transcript_88555/g.196915  ORF Transcript_88555/g.196915 Transcript_88555/m.196915 type:complete len:209 (+) Transcript_88555:411-1037(+)